MTVNWYSANFCTLIFPSIPILICIEHCIWSSFQLYYCTAQSWGQSIVLLIRRRDRVSISALSAADFDLTQAEDCSFQKRRSKMPPFHFMFDRFSLLVELARYKYCGNAVTKCNVSSYPPCG